MHRSQIVVCLGQFRIQPHRLLQGGGGMAPILLGHQDDPQLDVALRRFRGQPERGAAFVQCGVDISDLKEHLRQFQAIVRAVRRRSHCAAELAEEHHGINLFLGQEVRQDLFSDVRRRYLGLWFVTRGRRFFLRGKVRREGGRREDRESQR
ncbi:hypothetical protein NITMOv2_0794 [Nitrospira moscoviensis]|uniref:Uncharacterized protein n=1 Tax=Nitrospira moscoviensis TaxID=42253 RepID=A0A0K2G8P1_NITMO|nr:hypothetical protein NITMOv2_0794 [Nitrospira moscoviensis]